MNKFNENGKKLRESINTAIDNFKITYMPVENKTVTKLDGGWYIKDETTGNPSINMKKIDDNMHTEDSCKMNAAIKQHNHLKQQMKGNKNENKEAVYYSLVENESSSHSKGYYDCYVSDAISETIEETSDTLKEVTIWKAFNDNEKHLIKPGNYAYYRNGALFVCDSGGNVLKQLGNTIDENAYDNPNSYYILKDNEKKCYGDRYSDIQ